MVDVFLPVRQALIERLSTLEYLSIPIPVDDENLTHPKAILPVGTPPVAAWVLIQNQTMQDNSGQCCINQDTQLQIDILTEFPAGTGQNAGSYTHADNIANAILELLFEGCSNQSTLELEDGLNMWRQWRSGGTHLMSEFTNSRIYRNILIMSFSVQQTV